MIENCSDARFIEASQMPPLFATPERRPVSVKSSLSKVVRDMHSLGTPYQEAVREFQLRYIVGVLIKHACHLGRTADELGMHRNTLTRTLRDLKIDSKQIRTVMHILVPADDCEVETSIR